MFPSRSSTFPHFIFKSEIHSKLIFVWRMRNEPRLIFFFFFACGYAYRNGVSAPVLEKTVISQLTLHLCQKSANHICVYIWTTILFYELIIQPIPHRVDYCSFKGSFEIRWYASWNFVLPFQNCFSYCFSSCLLLYIFKPAYWC